MDSINSHYDDTRDLALQKAAELEIVVRDLKTFSIGISHDLRAPLRAIIGFSNALLEDHSDALDEIGRAYLVRISAAGHRMDQLIQDALIFGQMTPENFVLKPVNILNLVHEVSKIHPDLSEANVEITFDRPMPPVLAHESALFQCVSNLLSNAVKFTPGGIKPAVKIYSTFAEGRVRVFFRDNGIGIAAENQNRVFDLFHRVSHSSEGTGVGLAVVKRAVEKMGGSVGVESELAKGSTFWMEFALPSNSPMHAMKAAV
jgi:signal transduction histidine kinase